MIDPIGGDVGERYTLFWFFIFYFSTQLSMPGVGGFLVGRVIYMMNVLRRLKSVQIYLHNIAVDKHYKIEMKH